MRFELLVALLLVVLLHFIERSARDCSRKLEHPRAFGANPVLKILSFDPYQFAAHRSHMTHLEIWCGYASLKAGAALVFDGTVAAKTAPFLALSEVLPKSPLFEHTSKPN
jgi:hypothetical protein